MYFNTVYAPASRLIVYGPGGKTQKIVSEEGVRQGDAASALLFCMVMDLACARIKAEHRTAEVWCFMDDITIACSPNDVDKCMRTTKTILSDLGFCINLDKSAIAVSSREKQDA